MTKDPLKNISTGVTPQNQPIPGTVKNSAGGFSFAVDKWTRLNRFLILGTDGGSYYASEQSLTADNAKSVFDCIAEDGLRTLGVIRDISVSGRAPRQNQTLFAYAALTVADDADTRQAAYQVFGEIVRTGTHLFQFFAYRKSLNNNKMNVGAGLRRAVSRWMLQDADNVAYQAVKYRNREGWSHRDVLRQIHTSDGGDKTRKRIFQFMVKGETKAGKATPDVIKGYMQARDASSPTEVVSAIREFRLPWEAVPTDYLTDADVWRAIYETSLPLGALIRNLPRLTNLGLIRELDITARLAKPEAIAKARIHPLTVLNALETYKSGSGLGSSWTPDRLVVDALDAAFYLAFGNVTPTDKRTLIGLDVSGSMDMGTINRTNITPRVASAAMCMVTARVESDYRIGAFTSASGRFRDTAFKELDISPRQRLDDVMKVTGGLSFGGTDCALPMIVAQEKGWNIDTFIIYTDNETWAGDIHPHQALVKYRKATGIPARLVVVGMVSNGFSIADPKDAGELDVVGFDTASPELISSFARGEI